MDFNDSVKLLNIDKYLTKEVKLLIFYKFDSFSCFRWRGLIRDGIEEKDAYDLWP